LPDDSVRGRTCGTRGVDHQRRADCEGMSMRIEVDEAAMAEFRDATGWYVENYGAWPARRFVAEVRRVMAGVVENPRMWPEYEPGIRRALLTKFPYSLFYEIDEDRIRVFAIAHQRREPGYWHGRR